MRRVPRPAPDFRSRALGARPVCPAAGRILAAPRTPFRSLAAALLAVLVLLATPAPAQTYLGRLGGSPYARDSTANPYGPHGSPYGARSIQNPYGRWGSPYSAEGARNPYTRGGPRLYAEDGTYLGRLNANRYDPESVSNPYGRYGSPYSPQSIRNPYGRYGSPYSSQSPNNPYTGRGPRIEGD